MKILTWNINGIRATKYPLKNVLNTLDADIICLQETKVTRDQLDEASAIVEGYSSYFSFSKARSGYSGVATFVKDHFTPLKAEEGLSGQLVSDRDHDDIGCYGDLRDFDSEELNALDNEGRAVLTQHLLKDESGKQQTLTVINVYCPRADPEREDRKSYKLRFYKLLQNRAEALLASGSHVIILGDVNTSHKKIDNCDPGEDFEDHPGRKWLDGLLWQPENAESIRETAPKVVYGSPDKHGCQSAVASFSQSFVDSYRYFHPDQTGAYTCWCTVTGARATNYGTRIDYIFGNKELVFNAFTDCVLLQDFEGSDHCPVKAEIKWEPVSGNKCPSLCTKYMPEFLGKQQKLSAFFTKVSKSSDNISHDHQKSTLGVNEVNSKQKEKSPSKSPSKLGFFSQLSPKPQLKRSGSSTAGKNPKKLKLDDKKGSGVSKQGSLLGFFSKTNVARLNTESKCVSDSKTSSDSSCMNKNEDRISEKSTNIESKLTETKTEKSTSVGNNPDGKKAVVNSWKNLLKGPPPPPNCKGHSEPCLLRTVKKEESLNKGRQFWVCNRPEGHKTNPEARCDTFIWVNKKSKT